ncbi:MAG: hypothetical protein WKF82_02060 [Nocardioidaceae bacterium]
MTVLDAYAVLAYLRAEPCADAVASLLRSPTVLTAANAAEVLDQLVRVYRRDPDDVHADIAPLLPRAWRSSRSQRTMGWSRVASEPGTTTGSGARSAWPTAWPRQPHWARTRHWRRPTQPSPRWFAPKADRYIPLLTARASNPSVETRPEVVLVSGGGDAWAVL